jgi:hypothetical protein
VGLPLLSFIGPLTPLIRAQKDLLLAAALGLLLACFEDTGGFKLLPCLFAARLPAALRPPLGSLCLLVSLILLRDSFTPCLFSHLVKNVLSICQLFLNP